MQDSMNIENSENSNGNTPSLQDLISFDSNHAEEKIDQPNQNFAHNNFSFFWLVGEAIDDENIFDLVEYLGKIKTSVPFYFSYEQLLKLLENSDPKWTIILNNAYQKWLNE